MIGPFQGKYRFLSNFYPCKILVYDQVFYSVETAYQASKTFDINVREHMAEMTPSEAKAYGRTLNLPDNWEDQKLMIMEELVRRKFYSDRNLAQQLIDTGSEELVEINTWGDCFWSEYQGSGLNHLGKILMKIREEVKIRPTYYWN